MIRVILIAVVALCPLIFGDGCKRKGSSSDRTVETKGEDPRMAAAHKEAEKQWPKFVKAFNEGKPDRRFGVKAGFSGDGGTEYCWLLVDSLTEREIGGTMANIPEHNIGYKKDDRVSIPVSEMYDWMYTDVDGSMVGGFVEEVVQELMREQGGG